MEVLPFKFDDNLPKRLVNQKYGLDWPVVYIITNNNEAYIGETVNASIRAQQHLAVSERRKLKNYYIVSDDTFNKSVILDLEAFLISNIASDGKYKLQNGNSGLHNHNYYRKKMYQEKFNDIWNELKNKKVVENDLELIKNTDLFKYSPYKSLTVDQYMSVNGILNQLYEDIKNKKKSSFVVTGGAGTGKTILGIYILKLLMTPIEEDETLDEENLAENFKIVARIKKMSESMKIGLVIPQQSLRSTIKKTFRKINTLSSDMVYSPHEIAKSDEYFDLLIVDEAHRLRRRKNITNYEEFDKDNARFGLGKTGTELDWILKKSKYQIFFYDSDQSVKPTDITPEQFNKVFFDSNTHHEALITQQRCLLGGNEYVEYVKRIFSNNPPKAMEKFDKYEFKLFDDPNELIDAIKIKDKQYGLCRNVAGISFAWTRNKEKIVINNGEDIEFGKKKYIWNTKVVDWINSKKAAEEIGCIHTVQGYDLNYTGLIIGRELKYNPETNKIYVDEEEYKDRNAKAGATEEELEQYVLNIYSTMCLRGMLGTYVYACDPNLQEYLKKFIQKK